MNKQLNFSTTQTISQNSSSSHPLSWIEQNKNKPVILAQYPIKQILITKIDDSFIKR